jgi:hypothetical protein
MQGFIALIAEAGNRGVTRSPYDRDPALHRSSPLHKRGILSHPSAASQMSYRIAPIGCFTNDLSYRTHRLHTLSVSLAGPLNQLLSSVFHLL